MNKLVKTFCFFFIPLLLADPVSAQTPIDSLRLIGQKLIDPGLIIKGTRFGGISGIDRRPDGEYVLISDDRSEYSPARYYTAAILLSEQAVDSVSIKDVKILRNPDSSEYRLGSLDPESIRYKEGRIYWTSEGSRKEGIQPFFRVSDTSGYYIRDILLERKFRNNRDEKGLRDNASIEACSFSADGRALWTTNESPLYEDGPEADLNETKSPVRLTLLNEKNGKVRKQYAYLLSKITNEPVNKGFKINSVPEILAVSGNELLILEREYSTGRGTVVKLFKATTDGATNIRKVAALKDADYKPMKKKMLLDFSTLGLDHIDNIEGMTFGPTLPNGNKTLIFVADDNFNRGQFTQFIAFEVL